MATDRRRRSMEKFSNLHRLDKSNKRTASKQNSEVQPLKRHFVCLVQQKKIPRSDVDVGRGRRFRRQASFIRRQFRPERADSRTLIIKNCFSCCCRSKGFVSPSSALCFTRLHLLASCFRRPFNPPPLGSTGGGNEKEAPAAPLVRHLKATAGSGCVR